MRDEDLLQCPLLQGLDAMRRAELIGLLKDSNLRERLERCLGERSHCAETPAKATGSEVSGAFETEVHQWKPGAPLWRRSAKE